MAHRLAQPELHSPSRSLYAAANSSLCDRFSRHTSHVVNSSWEKSIISVGYPRHFPLAGSHVGSRNIYARADESLANQFGGVAAGDFFQLVRGIIARVQRHAAFRASEGDI